MAFESWQITSIPAGPLRVLSPWPERAVRQVFRACRFASLSRIALRRESGSVGIRALAGVGGLAQRLSRAAFAITSACLLVASPACVSPDPLARAWQHSLERGAAMGGAGLLLLLRLAVFLEVACIACGLSLRRTNKLPDGNREALQWVIAATSFMLALLLPLSALPIYGESRGFVALCSLLAVAVLPYVLSGLLVRRAGPRQVLAAMLYLGIVVLLASQLLG